MRRRNVTQQLLSSDDVVRFAFADSTPRRAIAIRVGKSVLGSIWLAGDDDELSADADAALRQAAPIAALQMMRTRLSVDVDRQLRESILASLLRGEEPSLARVEQIGLRTDEEFVVLALEITARSASSPPVTGPRLMDLVTLHLGAHASPAIGMAFKADRHPNPPVERIYVLTNLPAGGISTLRTTVAELLAHASRALSVELRGAVGHPVDDPAAIIDARRSADDCLEFAYRPGDVVDFDEVHDLALVRDVERMVCDWRGGTSPSFRKLLEHDAVNGTDYVDTLINLMDLFGSSSSVAQRMHLHPNTVRYRIKRITEISGVNLADGTARLALELELKAHTSSAPSLGD